VAREDLGWSTLLGMGAATAAVLVFGGVIGWLVDQLASTSPIFLLVGLAAGIVGAAIYTIAQFRRYMSD
jgi:F0F1-type ATP synthase assembly protein I